MPDFYETDRAVAEYLLFHYGTADELLPWPAGPRDALEFPRRCVTGCLGEEPLPPGTRALDLGCAVGRATFELARLGADAVGIDASRRFIEAGCRLLETGEIPYAIVDSGDRTRPAVARAPRIPPPGRVRFEVGDALMPRADLGTFEVVLAANLLDRVPRPALLLERLAGLVTPGGRLVLTSPYTWLEDYTPRTEWIVRGDTPTAELLTERLPGFRLRRRLDLPFLIREHARKFQWSVAEATVWERAR